MKKLITAVTLLALMLMVLCQGSMAEDAFHELIARINNPDNPVRYTIATLEYSIMDPPADFVPNFPEFFADATLTPADLSETPEGSYTVLAFPDDGVRFDFFPGEEFGKYVRQVNDDGTEQLFTITLSNPDMASAGNIMSAESDYLAGVKGFVEPIEAILPEEGWVLDSVYGQAWMDDRAKLEVFLEDADNYKVLISWGGSAWETAEWTYACDYDPETQTLNARHVIYDTIVYDDSGNETRTNVYEKETSAVFSLNDSGKVVITNAGEETLEGKTFERVPGTN